jgi:hypothetical protein
MKAAILLGVSKYQTVESLPACKPDVELMNSLLLATNQYNDHILLISDSTDGIPVKEKITSFIKNIKSKNDPVDELFFYYTGHGELFDNEFYYVLSDYNQNKRKQTSLENSEVDNLIRSLQPKLTIKVVDACRAGITYIKEDDTLKKHLDDTKGNFGNCYFMFSSKLDQSSYQDVSLSYFTKSFAKAIHNRGLGDIRYKDIMDFISDDFQNKKEQTPFFIVQAEYTEVFCQVSPDIKKVIEKLFETDQADKADISPQLESPTSEGTTSTGNNSSLNKLEMAIQTKAKSYRTEEQVNQLLEDIKNSVIQYAYPEEIKTMYEFSFSFDLYDKAEIPQAKTIEKWLSENKNQYFAEVEYKYLPSYVTSSIAAALFTGPREKTIVGFKPTVNCLYHVITIEGDPKYPNLSSPCCSIVILLSKTSMRFFYFYAFYKDENWNESALPTNVGWKTTEIEYQNEKEILSFVEDRQKEFSDFIINKLRQDFEVNHD